MSDLRELLKRVEAATGADRELDVRILAALLSDEQLTVKRSPFNGAWCAYRADGKLWETPSPFRQNGEITASIDAALVLVERVLPGWSWHIDSEFHGFPAYACLSSKESNGAEEPWLLEYETHDAKGKTPPLAILAALLRAKIAQEAKDA